MNEIPSASAIGYIQSLPQIIFPRRFVTDTDLLAMVLDDLNGSGSFEAAVLKRGSLFAVCAEVDWMDVGRGKLSELFAAITPIGKRGPNEFRAEVFLAALSQGVLACGQSPRHSDRLEESDLPEDIRARVIACRRSLIWKADPIVATRNRQ